MSDGGIDEWTCADGSGAVDPRGVDSVVLGRASQPSATPQPSHREHRVGENHTEELKDLWAAVLSLSRSLQPAHIQLRRFERGVPAAHTLPTQFQR